MIKLENKHLLETGRLSFRVAAPPTHIQGLSDRSCHHIAATSCARWNFCAHDAIQYYIILVVVVTGGGRAIVSLHSVVH